MKLINNDIHITRGETCAINLEVWNADGSPFILPSVYIRLLQAIASVSTENNHTTYTFYVPYDTKNVYAATGSSSTIKFRLSGPGSVAIKYIASTGVEATQTIYPTEENEYTANFQVHWPYILSVTVSASLEEMIHGPFMYTTDISKAMVSALAFTVRAAERDTVVLQKYANLHTNIMVNGETDQTVYGWNKFTSNNILRAETEDQVLEQLNNAYTRGEIALCQHGNDYYQLWLRNSQISDKLYKFAMTLPLLFEDTSELHNGEYKYDVVIYQGYINSLERFNDNEFPYSEVIWKKSIIAPHKFIVTETNNA